MKYKVSAMALALMVPFGAHAQQPTLEQNVDAMLSKSISVSAAFHDTIISMHNTNTQLVAQIDELTKQRDAFKAERDDLKAKLEKANWQSHKSGIPPEGITPETPPNK